MTIDEQIIMNLTREVGQQKQTIQDLLNQRTIIDRYLNEADMPSGFEDGNSWDDFDQSERMGILVESYNRLRKPTP